MCFPRGGRGGSDPQSWTGGSPGLVFGAPLARHVVGGLVGREARIGLPGAFESRASFGALSGPEFLTARLGIALPASTGVGTGCERSVKIK